MERDIFEKCLKLYAAYDEEAAKLIGDADVSEYEIYPTHLGEDNLTRRHGGKDFFFHPQDGARLEAKRWIKNIKLDGIELIYIYGIGLGYYYDELREWLHKDPARYVVFLESDLSALNMLFKTEKGLEILRDDKVVIQTFAIENFKIVISLNPNCYLLFSAFHDRSIILSALKSYADRRIDFLLGIKSQIYISTSWHRNVYADKLLYLKDFTANIINNILNLEQESSFEALMGSFKNIPAIIAGAGPSVVKDIHLFEQAKKKCLLIGSGTGTNVLNSHGILPHFFVGIDPTTSQESRVRMNSSYMIPCFHKPRFSSAASRFATGEKVYLKGCLSPFSTCWFEEYLGIHQSVELESGISSTTFAIEIAHAMGCNPIILSGLDLAYTDNKRYPEVLRAITHGSKTIQDELESKSKTPLIERGYEGQEVITKIDWLVEGKLISIFKGKHPELTLYNGTRGGLLIEHIPNVFLDDFLKGLSQDYDIEGRLHALIESGAIRGSDRDRPLNAVKEWKGFVLDFLRVLEDERDSWRAKTSQDTIKVEIIETVQSGFIEQFKANPFFNIFLASHEELMRGSLLLKNTMLKKVRAEKKADLFRQAADDYVEAFFDFWETVAKEHLQGVEEALSDYMQERGWNRETVFSTSDTEFGSARRQSGDVSSLKKITPSVFQESQEKEGVLDGRSCFFGKDLQPLAISWYTLGVIEGIQEFFYPSGKLFARKQFSGGKLQGEQHYFFEEGSKRAEMFYRDGKLEGDVTLYHPNGHLKRLLQFREGKLSGSEQLWNAGGTLLFSASYKEGKPCGEAVEYYVSGKLLRRTVFDGMGKRISLEEFAESGQPRADECSELNRDAIYPLAVGDAIENYLEELDRLYNAFGSERERHFF